jgi:phosphatidylserine/phosphatidylglycerophosphate/cardiolipin synthase-like enzyme
VPGNFNPNTKALGMLNDAGVRVKWSSPRFVYTHEKSMVIDDGTAYIMTTNFTGAAFSANREYIVVDRVPAEAAEVAKVFDADWIGAAITPSAPNLVVSPVNSRAKILSLIDSARKSLVIQMEFFSDPEVLSHLAARVKAGVATTVMLSYQSPDKCSGGDINADEAKALAGVGVTNLAFIHALTMHGKLIIADGARAYVGSENLSANSLDNNREMGIIVTDPGIVGTLTQVALKDYAAK